MIMGEHGREAEREARREAYMRQKIRDALKRGRERVAVVCGAWHAPVLRWPLPPAAHGRAYSARRTAAQDHFDLGALDSSATRLSHWLRSRHRLTLAGTTISGSRRTGRLCAGWPRLPERFATATCRYPARTSLRLSGSRRH
jgi:hypothetical protein